MMESKLCNRATKGQGEQRGHSFCATGQAKGRERRRDYESQDQTKPIPCHVGATFTLRGMG